MSIVFWDIWMDVSLIVRCYQQQPQITLTWACALVEFDTTSAQTVAVTWLRWTLLSWSPWSKSRRSLKWLELRWDVWLVVLSCTRFCSYARQAAKCPLHPKCSCIQAWFTCGCTIKLLNNSLSKEVNFQIWYSWQCTVKLYSINLNVQTYKTVCARN